MTRVLSVGFWVVGAGLMAACAKSRPASDTAMVLPPPDTIGALRTPQADSAVLLQKAGAAGSSSKGAPAIPAQPSPTTKADSGKQPAGKVLGRDSVIKDQPIIAIPSDTGRRRPPRA